MRAQNIILPGFNSTQTYTYDNVDRLTGASESGTGSWSESYHYDGPTGSTFGNRWVDAPTRSGLPALTLETPQGPSWFAGGNRINGWTTDSSGNVQAVASMSRSFTYDAENRQTTATISSAVSSYTYDGEGQRVQKSTGGVVTTYVYDAWGNLAAEYSSQGGAVSDCLTATCYVTVDHLGSTRLLTNSAGTVAKRYDYLPFGAEIPAGTAGRTILMGYQPTPDSFNPKFTGQWRDPETGLDYFHARYYSPAQGRFTGVDPGNAGADLADPQPLNGYAYVNNNPLSFKDPSGEGIFGSLGSIIGSFFPGFGTLIGWGIGSIADLATGQSITPPGALGLGSSIIGSIAGGVNSGPWNEHFPIGGGTGPLNTGTVFGSGNTGPFVFSVIKVQMSVPMCGSGPLSISGCLPAGYGIYNWDIARAYLMQVPVMARTIRALEASRTVYTVKLNKGGTDDYDAATHTISWDPLRGLGCTTGGTQSPALGLGHELAHALGPMLPFTFAPHGYDNIEERRVITGAERTAAGVLGECVRNNHRGAPFGVANPIMH